MFSTKFISATKEYSGYGKHVPAPYFRKTFEIGQPIQSATLCICGLGFYRLSLNGRKITKGALAPYISNPDDLLYYDRYDVTEYITEGKNVIGILLGNGMLNCPGGAIWDFEKVRYRCAPKVAFSFDGVLEDGEELHMEADTSIRTQESPILFDDLRCGEIYDARKEIPGWNLPDFDDQDWPYAIPAETPRGETVLCQAEPIVTHKELKPCRIEKGRITHLPSTRATLPVFPITPEDQEGYLFDFGENLAGNVRLRIKGTSGQRVVLQFGEILAEDGGLDLRAMSFQPHQYNHRIVYYLKGDGVEEYFPSFTYQGFRYCLVSGITEEQATAELLTYAVMGSWLGRNGDFSCSNETANQLLMATYRADLANFYYFPTDCPHREKNGWTADAALSTEQMLFLLTPENSYREWLRNIRKAQREDGALPGIIPTGGWGFTWGNGPAWDCVLVYLPYYTWIYRGTTDIVRENVLAIMRYLNYIALQRDEKGLLHIGLGDWVHIGRNTPKSPLEVTDTLISMDICKKAQIMFHALGMACQEQFACSLYHELRQAARQELIEPDGATVVGHCQTSQAMGIYYDLFDNGEKTAAFQVLSDYITNNKEHMDVGVLGGRVLFHVLADFGQAERAFAMIVNSDYPSYGHWIEKENCTALFEAFQKKDSSPSSKNHHFWGDISSWFLKHIVGIHVNPYAKDANEVEVRPNFISTLQHAQAYIGIPAGKVDVRWEKQDEKILLTVQIPEGCHGKIRLPMDWEAQSENRLSYLPLKSGVFELKRAECLT